MKKVCSLIFTCCLLAGCTQTQKQAAAKIDFTGAKIIDLSHAFEAQTIYWPTEDGFKLEKRADGFTDRATTTRRTLSPPRSTAARISTRPGTLRSARIRSIRFRSTNLLATRF